MSYYNQLHPWHIIHCLPRAQAQIIARFRRRNDAEAHLRILQQLTPTATYRIIFAAIDDRENGDRTDTGSIQLKSTVLRSRQMPFPSTQQIQSQSLEGQSNAGLK